MKVEEVWPGTEFSKLRPYSLGIVAENKALSSKDVEVVPYEQSPILDGEITSDSTDIKAKGVDSLGSVLEKTVSATLSVKAKWLPIGASNRVTAPDVRRGEIVMLYKFADADMYFWNTLKDDISLRKLETVIYAFSATMNESGEMNANTYYFIEVSTHKKLITLHTSKDNGEPFSYDIQLNTEAGYFVITDDIGNHILMDSKNSRIHLKNIDGSECDLDKTNVTIKAPDDFTVECNNYSVRSKGHYSVQSGSSSMSSSGATSIDAGSSLSISSPNTSIA